MGNKLLPAIQFVKPSDKDKILRQYIIDLNSGYRCAMKNLKESFWLKRGYRSTYNRSPATSGTRRSCGKALHDEKLVRSH